MRRSYEITFIMGDNVLDIGCGSGTITLGVADAVNPGRVVGIDTTDERVESAKDWRLQSIGGMWPWITAWGNASLIERL